MNQFKFLQAREFANGNFNLLNVFNFKDGEVSFFLLPVMSGANTEMKSLNEAKVSGSKFIK